VRVGVEAENLVPNRILPVRITGADHEQCSGILQTRQTELTISGTKTNWMGSESL
jgi:hypothetical protein